MNDSLTIKELFVKCYCESRKTQAYLTQCLDKCPEEQREYLIELVEKTASTSKKIKEFYEKH
ncbi:hypothetical protein [Rummeliibacillus sp. BSL5]